MGEQTTDGGCACGAVRYHVLGRPLVSNVCHCSTCRKTAGSPAVAWITLPTAKLVLLQGRTSVFHSSSPVTRTFCGACGTPLTYVHRDRPGEIDLTTCSLDDPSTFPPTYHSWVSHGPTWLRFGDDLPIRGESKRG